MKVVVLNLADKGGFTLGAIKQSLKLNTNGKCLPRAMMAEAGII
jgi:hypothetical protein